MSDQGRITEFICDYCGGISADPYYCWERKFCDDEHAMEWASDRIEELEQLLRKVVEDSECGVVPRSHLDRIEAALQTTEADT